MKSIVAFILMGLWTVIIASILYKLEAHIHYRNILWAVSLSITLLVTHMINMVIYFKVTGKQPYKWFKE